MHKESWSALASARRTSVHPQCASTATMDIIRTRARLTATTGRVTSPAVFLSAPARGSTVSTADQASTAALGFTVAATSMIAGTFEAASAGKAFTVEAASTATTNEVATQEVAFTAAEASMVGAVSMVAEDSTEGAVPTAEDAGKFHFLAPPCGAHSRAK